MLEMDNRKTMGKQWVTSTMMGGGHAGQPIGMMGSGWKHGTHFGRLFQLTSG
ncbi:MAG: hypothetical protein ABI742_05995 [Gemmatimonadota bacterium]